MMRWFKHRQLSYTCSICEWQGLEEPTEPGQGVQCPSCGSTIYPLSWGDTWGNALLIVCTVVVIVALVYVFRR